jgi:hypothetical protein
MDFVEFPKISRLTRLCTVTEKLDGTNASIVITDEGEFLTGSRTRWITPTDDNYGFSKWAHANKEELMKLGPGSHFGEWWGLGIQRNYGLKEKRFSLFNTSAWSDASVRPACCSVVPVLYSGLFDTTAIYNEVEALRASGSVAAPGFMKPEGIVVWHDAARIYFKKTIEKDESPKGRV